MLLPAMHRAREMARAVQCLSNLRQCALAAQDYTMTFNEYYPMAYYNKIDPPYIISYAWDFNTTRDWTTTPPVDTVEPGLLWQRGGDPAIQQCPSFGSAHNWLADPFTGYNYNTSYIGMKRILPQPRSARLSHVKDPVGTALFGDGQYAGGANKFMRSPWASPSDEGFAGRCAGTQGFRHLGKTNVAFCDGHAQPLEKCYTDTYPSEQTSIAPNTGFLAPDNSLYDLK